MYFEVWNESKTIRAVQSIDADQKYWLHLSGGQVDPKLVQGKDLLDEAATKRLMREMLRSKVKLRL